MELQLKYHDNVYQRIHVIINICFYYSIPNRLCILYEPLVRELCKAYKH